MADPAHAPPLAIDGRSLTLADVAAVARGGRRVALAPAARARMVESHRQVVAAGALGRPVYGVTTGFGSLARVSIAPADRARLSLNLLRSHAAGVGPSLPGPVVRAMMLLRANALARGVSGCRPLLVDTLCAMLDAGVTPVVPSQGSCGSSGDLAPLAHLGLVLAAGEHACAAVYGGEVLPGAEAMARAGIPRVELEAKDGLALTNGAQLTTAIAALACTDACRLLRQAEVAAALSIEALCGCSRAFHPAVHAERPYPGARATAANLRALLAGSALIDSVPGKVQDAYSLRCTPQVLGAARDAVAFARGQVSIEINSATDNPLILGDPGAAPEGFAHDAENPAFSAGAFHGEPVGIPMDLLKIAVAEVASLAERRLYRLTTGTLSHRLPPGLAHADRPALGLMLPQTTAAALVSENKALGWPASLDSIPTCEDQEDHVAMSTTAARRAAEVLANSRRVLAVELLGACNALRFRQEAEPGLRLGAGTAVAWATVSAALPPPRPEGTPADDLAALDALLDGDALFAGLPALLPVGAAPPEGR